MTDAQVEAPERTVRVHLDVLLRRSGKTQVEVAEAIGIHTNNLSRLRNGHVSFIRLDTLGALCRELECQPGELLTYE
jgi:putative transcriptional regulator